MIGQCSKLPVQRIQDIMGDSSKLGDIGVHMVEFKENIFFFNLTFCFKNGNSLIFKGIAILYLASSYLHQV